MKRFASLVMLLGLATLLSGCIVAPYGRDDGGYRGDDRHEHHDDRDRDGRRDENRDRYHY